MKVSKALKELARYVTESTGDERVYALCVFADVAVQEGTKDAERYCAEVLSYALSDDDQSEEDQVEEVADREKRTLARKVSADTLTEIVASLDPSLDKDVVRLIAKNVLRQLGREPDEGIRARLSSLLRRLGVPLERIPNAQLAVFAAAHLAVALAA